MRKDVWESLATIVSDQTKFNGLERLITRFQWTILAKATVSFSFTFLFLNTSTYLTIIKFLEQLVKRSAARLLTLVSFLQ